MLARSAVLFVLLLLAAACRRGDPAATAAPSEIAVTTALVVAEDVDVTIRSVGTLRANQLVAIKPKRAGHVRELRVAEGARVEAGDVLVVLDNDALQAQIEVARASVADASVRERNARQQCDRSNALLTKGVTSQQQYDDMRAELDRAVASRGVAQANLAFAQAQLADSVIRAPFAGILGQRRVDMGAFVREGEAVISLVDLDPVELIFSLSERYLGSLAVGQSVDTTVVSHPGKVFPGTVTFIDPEVDPVNRTVTAKAVIENPDHLLRPGQFATAVLRLDRHLGASVIPEEAVVPEGDRGLVFVVENGNAVARSVQTGIRLPGRVEIIEGLRPGERVVNTGHEKLQPGAPAAVLEVAPPGQG